MRGFASILALGFGLGLAGCSDASPPPAEKGSARSGLGERPQTGPRGPTSADRPTPGAGCSAELIVRRDTPETLPPLPRSAEGLAPLARLPVPGPVTGLAVTDDGQRVVIVGADRVHVWRPSPPEGTPALLAVPSPEDAGWCARELPALRERTARTGEPPGLRASADVDQSGAIAAVAGHDGVLRVYDLAAVDAEGPVRVVSDADAELVRIVWGGQMTVTAGVDGLVAREVVSGKVRWRVEPPSAWSEPPRELAIAPDAEWAAVVDSTGRVWRAPAGESLEAVDELEMPNDGPSRLAIDASGHLSWLPAGQWPALASVGETHRVAVSRGGAAVALDVGDEIAVYRLSDAPASPRSPSPAARAGAGPPDSPPG